MPMSSSGCWPAALAPTSSTSSASPPSTTPATAAVPMWSSCSSTARADRSPAAAARCGSDAPADGPHAGLVAVEAAFRLAHRRLLAAGDDDQPLDVAAD